MIPRYSLYGDPQRWDGDIRPDPDGQWVKWRSVVPYINFAQGQGFNYEEPTPDQPVPIDPMVDLDTVDILELEEAESIPDDEIKDVYDFIDSQIKREYMESDNELGSA